MNLLTSCRKCACSRFLYRWCSTSQSPKVALNGRRRFPRAWPFKCRSMCLRLEFKRNIRRCVSFKKKITYRYDLLVKW